MKKSLKSSLLGIIITSAFTPAISFSQDFDWSGFYLGGSAGSAKNDSDWKGSGDFNSDTGGIEANADFNLGDFTRKLSDSSSIYGLYAGYNFQKNNIVYGVELDYSTLSGSKDVQLDGGEGAVLGGGEGYVRLESEPNHIASAKLRLGYAADKFLVFGTAGIAYNNTKQKWSDTNTFNYPETYSGSISQNTGWVAGAGVDYALTDNIILRGEGLYYDFNSDSDRNPAGSRFTVEQDVKVFRLGFAYKF